MNKCVYNKIPAKVTIFQLCQDFKTAFIVISHQKNQFRTE